ncbi:MAG TPA: LytTR family DNA-binding domain-containing protein [Saprospiraceae bacterium]|nr:LytTR family DNA-binding domain-containing protein [Saprospiraceae bacterium]
MIKAVIIDDEKNALDVLSSLLKNYCPQVQISAKCKGGEEGIEAIKAFDPDLVFLDIEMPKINGFDVLNQTKDYHYKVIFTTAYDQFAIKAFKYSAIDYLLKPIDIEELKLAVQKINTDTDIERNIKINELLNQLNANINSIEAIALPVGTGYEMIRYDDIVRCEGDRNYSVIHLTDGRKITLSKTLKDVETTLNRMPFYRIHHSHLINLKFVKKMYKNEGGYVVMQDGTSINISRSKKDEFWEKVIHKFL